VDLSVSDLLAAPIGVALLDLIEAENREELVLFHALADSNPGAVARGVQQVNQMTSPGLGVPVLQTRSPLLTSLLRRGDQSLKRFVVASGQNLRNR